MFFGYKFLKNLLNYVSKNLDQPNFGRLWPKTVILANLKKKKDKKKKKKIPKWKIWVGQARKTAFLYLHVFKGCFPPPPLDQIMFRVG